MLNNSLSPNVSLSLDSSTVISTPFPSNNQIK